ncbi:MAG: hypothetical protein M9930_19040 [Anaerolineae bacterium]|nr:hypothetical protein [Anaerolineae bacterium]
MDDKRELEALRAYLHERMSHPWYEYEVTDGPRKAWPDADTPPDGDGWICNVHIGRNGWERFDYHEESYWMRLRPQEES